MWEKSTRPSIRRRPSKGNPLTIYGLQYTARQWAAAQWYRAGRKAAGAERLQSLARNPERVVIVIAGLLGDTVMSVPVLGAARRAWPQARLTLLGMRHNCELLAGCTEIDDFIEAPALPFSIRRRRELQQLQDTIAARRFGVGLLILGDQFALMLAKAGVPVRVGVRGSVLAPCLTHEYAIGSPRTWGPDERLNALRVLGLEVPQTPTRLQPPPSALSRGSDALCRLGLDRNAPYAVVHPFGSTPRQWWPIDRAIDVHDHLAQEHGLRTVIIGGADASSAVPRALAERAIDTTGQLTITELVGVLAGAALVVSTDSGPFHIAGALGRPLVGLFRKRRPEHADKYPQARVVFGPCASCERECTWDSCAATPCRQMGAIAAGPVAAALDAAAEHARSVPSR